MGAAKLRRDAIAAGQPWPEDFHLCPRCRSRDTKVEMMIPPGLSEIPTLVGVCRCGAAWEAYPADWSHDAVEAQPCDNCAFRAGSPESRDKEAWRAFLADLRTGREFRCHKGAPILIDREALTIEFDADWIRKHGRTCAGFVRVLQSWPDWIARRIGDPSTDEIQDALHD